MLCWCTKWRTVAGQACQHLQACTKAPAAPQWAAPAASLPASRRAPKSDTACVSAAEPERHRKTLSASGVILSDVRLLMYVPARAYTPQRPRQRATRPASPRCATRGGRSRGAQARRCAGGVRACCHARVCAQNHAAVEAARHDGGARLRRAARGVHGDRTASWSEHLHRHAWARLDVTRQRGVCKNCVAYDTRVITQRLPCRAAGSCAPARRCWWLWPPTPPAPPPARAAAARAAPPPQRPRRRMRRRSA